MNLCKKLILGVAMIVSFASYAIDYPLLTFKLVDNSEFSVASEDLTMTYSNQNLQLKSSTIDQTIPVNTIKSMKFKITSTGLDALLDNNSMGKVELYNISGANMGIYNSIEEARSKVPAGIYVVKNNNKSFKVIF